MNPIPKLTTTELMNEIAAEIRQRDIHYARNAIRALMYETVNLERRAHRLQLELAELETRITTNARKMAALQAGDWGVLPDPPEVNKEGDATCR